MKTVLMVFITTMVMLISFLNAEVKNPDKPLKGEWDFKLKEIWSLDKVGEEVFAKPRKITVSDDGTIYIYDRQNSEYYIISKEGKFVKTFGISGEGPGEIKRFYNADMVKDTLIVVDAYEIEYYDKNGNPLKSLKNDYTKRLPDHFLNENEFVYFPLVITRVDNLPESIFRYNIEKDEKTLLAEFKVFKGSHGQSGERIVVMILPPITPLMTAAYDTDRFYYAVNNLYEITAADFAGKKIDTFSLDRNKTKVTKEERRHFVKNGPMPLPAEMVDKIADSLPEELTYFTRMEVQNKLLFVYVSYLSTFLENQQIDIFSPEGKYLYKANIKTEDGSGIIAGPHALLHFKDNYLYMMLENENGDITLKKYQVEMPKL